MRQQGETRNKVLPVAANNGTPQTPKSPQPCYSSNSLRDQEVRLFSLLRLADTWEEWAFGGGSKFAWFGSAKAGAVTAGGETSETAAAIVTVGKGLSAVGTALKSRQRFPTQVVSWVYLLKWCQLSLWFTNNNYRWELKVCLSC